MCEGDSREKLSQASFGNQQPRRARNGRVRRDMGTIVQFAANETPSPPSTNPTGGRQNGWAPSSAPCLNSIYQPQYSQSRISTSVSCRQSKQQAPGPRSLGRPLAASPHPGAWARPSRSSPTLYDLDPPAHGRRFRGGRGRDRCRACPGFSRARRLLELARPHHRPGSPTARPYQASPTLTTREQPRRGVRSERHRPRRDLARPAIYCLKFERFAELSSVRRRDSAGSQGSGSSAAEAKDAERAKANPAIVRARAPAPRQWQQQRQRWLKLAFTPEQLLAAPDCAAGTLSSTTALRTNFLECLYSPCSASTGPPPGVTRERASGRDQTSSVKRGARPVAVSARAAIMFPDYKSPARSPGSPSARSAR